MTAAARNDAMQKAFGACIVALPRNAAALHSMSSADLLRRIAVAYPTARPATAEQLAAWVDDFTGAGLGLGDLGRWGAIKKIQRVVHKAVDAGLAPVKAAFDPKTVKKEADFAVQHPQQTAEMAAAVATLNPAVISAAAVTVSAQLKQQQLAQAQQAAQQQAAQINAQQVAAQQDAQTQAIIQAVQGQSGQGQPRVYDQYGNPVQASYMPYDGSPGDGQVLYDAEGNVIGGQAPGFAGLWNAIVASVKANPVPWAVGGGVTLILLARR